MNITIVNMSDELQVTLLHNNTVSKHVIVIMSRYIYIYIYIYIYLRYIR